LISLGVIESIARSAFIVMRYLKNENTGIAPIPEIPQ
jgi:hypothetical protein